MAEERNPLTARSETTGFTSEPDDDAARLRGDIERTREQMSATIDELEARLRPSNLLSQAKETVKVKATDTMNRVVSNASDTAERAAGQARTSARAASAEAFCNLERNRSADRINSSGLPPDLRIDAPSWPGTVVSTE